MSMMWLFMHLLLSWPTTKAKAESAAASADSNTRSGCSGTCGDVIVPYPFGIGARNCALDDHFFLNCTNESSLPKAQLMFGQNIIALSVEDGTLFASIPTANSCYNSTGFINGSDFYMTLGAKRPFRFSNTRNKLTALGCDTLAIMSDAEGSFASGCVSLCTNVPAAKYFTEETCWGIGCCQTPFPKSLKTLNISLGSLNSHTKIPESNSCDYAILVDKNFNSSDLRISSRGPDEFITSNVTIEWVVKEEKCEVARNSADYACGQNAYCTYSENGQGYRCLCNEGFQGNPYLGCHDIDECKEAGKYKCEGTCKNTIGNYTCSCPLGMQGDGKLDCRGFRIATIVAVIGAAIFTVIIGVLIFVACKERRKERNFLKNGGVLLKHQRVRIFSEAELAKATKNYDSSWFLGEGGFGSVYKGVLPDNTFIAVKRPKDVEKIRITQEFQHEIGIVSQINHKNVVKILGLCLQTKVPLLVYEFVSNGTLFQHIHDKSSQVLETWKNRLRIAAETALALDYFHSLASPPIIHGDVKSTNILLDDKYTAKVADFGASVLISPDQTAMATKIQGTFGYLDPEYLMTGNLTEKSDVYSFGVVLVELLTGVKPGSRMASNEKINTVQYFLSSIEKNSLFEILCFGVANEEEMEEIEIVAELAKRCLSSSGINRPTMKEVADELGKLKKLHDNLFAQQNSAETERLLGESSNCLVGHPMAMIAQPATHSALSFDIESYSYSM